MKITKRQLRRIIKEAMPAGGVPDIVGAVTGVYGEENRRKAVDLTDPNVSEEQISAAWPDDVYHNGKNVYQTFYNDRVEDDVWSWLQSEKYGDGQEAYLGYDPQSDMFVMGFDAFYDDVDEYGDSDPGGEMEGVLLLLDPSGQVRETITSVGGGMYPYGLRAARTAMPAIIDVRLD